MGVGEMGQGREKEGEGGKGVEWGEVLCLSIFCRDAHTYDNMPPGNKLERIREQRASSRDDCIRTLTKCSDKLILCLYWPTRLFKP